MWTNMRLILASSMMHLLGESFVYKISPLLKMLGSNAVVYEMFHGNSYLIIHVSSIQNKPNLDPKQTHHHLHVSRIHILVEFFPVSHRHLHVSRIHVSVKSFPVHLNLITCPDFLLSKHVRFAAN